MRLHEEIDNMIEEKAKREANFYQRQKLLDLYYDCCEILDNDPIMRYAQWDMRTRLNRFFQKELNKSL